MCGSSVVLNDSQKEAVHFSERRLLVVAGPGTGKTRTLTSRIAFLVNQAGAEAESILALTFTNRAADEMRTRLTELLGAPRAGALFIGTFHALGFEILRREWASFGFRRPPFIYDEEDRRMLIARLLAEAGQKAVRSTIGAVLSLVDRDRSQSPVRETGDDIDYGPIARAYVDTKRAESAVDFGDLIALPLDLFDREPERLSAYRARWHHLFVDEYQDVNAAQVELITKLEEGSESFMAIGDPDQAIYSFRGSDVKHFVRFAEDFPGSTVLHLRDNYRSTATILEASGQIIRFNRRFATDAPRSRSHNRKGLRLHMESLPSDRAESRYVVRTIENLVGGVGRFGIDDVRHGAEEDDEEYGFSDIAVLYRLNAQAAQLCAALDESGIPYQRVGSRSGGGDPLERGILALARLAEGSDRAEGIDASFRRLESIKVAADPVVSSLRRTLSGDDPGTGPPVVRLLHAAGEILAAALPAEADALRRLSRLLARRALDSAASRLDFISAAALVISEDPWAARCEKITLSTIHAAKGLEFPVVFITGLEEGLIPYIRKDEPDRAAALEEERRLVYVGMTRAKHRLHLTSARHRFLFGQGAATVPSPYLREISDDLVRFVRTRSRREKGKPSKGDGAQMGLFE